jgi:hypothetical protein
MATIYRFLVESSVKGGAKGGRSSGENSDKKTGKTTTLLQMISNNKGGVEHNRKLRAINPLINKMTGGYWEKSMRLGRSMGGLLKFKVGSGGALKFAGLSGPAVAIIIALAISVALKYQKLQIKNADELNKYNYKAMESGNSAIRGQFQTSVNVFTGRISYNQNK